MKSLYKLLVDKNKKAEKYIKNPKYYAEKIKNVFSKRFKDVKVLLFGSVITNQTRPNSDVDVLIISKYIPKTIFEQVKLKLMIERKFPNSPFELHLVTPAEFKNWYKNFIKSNYIEV